MGISMQRAISFCSLDKPVGERVCGRGGSRREVELREDIGDVTGDGFFADIELLSDGPVGLASCDEAEHLNLTRGQAVGRLERAVGNSGVDPREIRCRAQ